jgi:hypothetical protein
MTGPEEALHLRCHQTGAGVEQGERRAFEIVAIRMRAMALMEILTDLQAADTNALIEIQSRTPSQLQTLFEAIPDLPVFPEHARSIRLQPLGKDIGHGLGGRAERFSYLVPIGSALGCFSNQTVEQLGKIMP